MDLKNVNILIVEDNKTNRLILSRRLEQQGYNVVCVVDGQEALEIITEQTFDLVLLDIMMPGIDGYEVCQKLKEDDRTKGIPVIFITAMATPESIVKGFEVGGVDYITKPFNGQEVLARIRTHLELKRSREELQQANATKDKFFSIIAHDIRNPLSAAMMMADFLQNKSDDPNAVQRASQNIRESIYNLNKLLENLLQWSRAQIGTIGYNPQKLVLNELVDSCIYFLANNAQAKGVDLYSEITKDVYVMADSQMITTVLRNLISNALKFTGKGGTIKVVAHDNGNAIQVSVVDTGVGISTERAKKIFRIDEANKSTPGTSGERGTGLGLILCKEFIKNHNGKIWVESQVDEGSKFIFSLPKVLEQ